MHVFKCNSAKLFFEEFPQIKLRLWGEHLWSEGYAVRTAGIVTSVKIEEYVNKVEKCFLWILAPQGASSSRISHC